MSDLKVVVACVCCVSLINFAVSFVPYVKILNDVPYVDNQFSERTRVHREPLNHRAGIACFIYYMICTNLPFTRAIIVTELRYEN